MQPLVINKDALLWFVDYIAVYVPSQEHERLLTLRHRFQALSETPTLIEYIALFLELDTFCWMAMPKILPPSSSLH